MKAVQGLTDWDRRPEALDTEARLLSLGMARQLVERPGRDTAYPSTNPSHVLTISSIVGRLFGFAVQHFSMNFHISAVSPSFSVPWGLAGLFPLTI